MEKLILILVIVGIVSYFAEAARPFDGVNVDQMLQNPPLVQRQIRCLSCKGPCDRIGAELKRVIPQVAATSCSSCTASEKMNFGKIVNHVQTYYPREWAEVSAVMRSGRRC